jgi:L-ribulokinase
MTRWPPPRATRCEATGVDGAVAAIALDTTGSSVIPVGEGLEPLDEYYLWCDHRAFAEAEEITAKAHALGFEGIEWCGGVYSSEWGFSKLLHWLRHNPEKRPLFVTALEHCDMVAATLSGITSVSESSAASAPWATNGCGIPSGMGCRRKSFWSPSTRSLPACAPKLGGEYLTSDHLAGHLSQSGPRRWACAPAFPFPSAHSTRIGTPSAQHPRGRCGQRGRHFDLHHRHGPPGELVPGVCGVVPGSVHPATPALRPGSRLPATFLRHRAPRGHHGRRALRRPGRVQGGADRTAAPELG